ncbi:MULTISPECIES: alpha/beta hydrolase [unclassified Streptomyces]|uniref:alpha/beta hydrolase n=1 Tax=unclassified Streptomyces TaxID=2593676 RepID=UPI0022535947|nr:MULTISPECIES: alpha/beta fold hydrolase [unclassified Streptomyces]MCX4793961.1 alpha/beta fold hydrolase [Streptomyces sp. NBC_01242]WSP61807.1 alpha/beta fold hydrolase [Streptomyces sp. NBC_01240]WSU20881.1 alpha/beta fold hydrolase [Streptomyces sp. NBC_01108]
MPQLSSVAVAAPQIRAITLHADGLTLSALLAEPVDAVPRAVLVALHGGGMRAGYFDNRARPGLSLLALGAQLGYTVLAVDRPGYGLSAARLPRGLALEDSAPVLRAALADFSTRYDTGAGLFLVAHSYGGKLALSAADAFGEALIGMDISGLGNRVAVAPHQLPGPDGQGDWRKHWGALRLYPPDAFRLGQALVSPVPEIEAAQGPLWPELYPELAARVRVPVRFTFAEQEQWWRYDEEAVAALTRPLASARVRVDHQPDAGHNISLGWAARTYHLRVCGFLEECLLARDAAVPQRRPVGAAV